MATTIEQSKKNSNRVFTDVYIKRRFDDGTYESDWKDITRQVVRNSLSDIKLSLDAKDFDIGIFTTDNVTVTFDNSDGRFNDIEDSRSFWGAFQTRHLTKFRIDYGYLDDNGDNIGSNTFIGFLDERSLRISSNDDATVTILSRDFLLSTVNVPAGLVSSATAASEVLFRLLSRGEITQHLTISRSNIAPNNDITIDDPSEYDAKKVDSVVNEILLLTNSVAYIDQSDNYIVKSRNSSNQVTHRFYNNPIKKRKASDNVYGIRNINSGRNRVKNAFFWSGSTEVSRSDSVYLERYGLTKKTFNAAAITNTTTRQSILDRLRTEFEFPKKEFEVETDYLGPDIELLQTVAFDVRPEYTNVKDVAEIGQAVIGTSKIVGFGSGIFLQPDKGYKVIQIRHSLKNAKTILKVREVGKTLTDGYLTMLSTQIYTAVFTAATSVDINTAADSINAQQAKVEVLDSGSDFETTELQITRPSTSIIRLTSTASITKTFSVLVAEVVIP